MLLIHCLFLPPLFVGLLCLVLICYAVLSDLSSFCNHLDEQESSCLLYFNCLAVSVL